MGLLDDAIKGWGGFALGVGAAFAAPGLVTGAGSVLRSFAKLVIRTALAVSNGVRATAAEVGEQVSDLVAEVQAERDARTSAPPRRTHVAALNQ